MCTGRVAITTERRGAEVRDGLAAVSPFSFR